LSKRFIVSNRIEDRRALRAKRSVTFAERVARMAAASPRSRFADTDAARPGTGAPAPLLAPGDAVEVTWRDGSRGPGRVMLGHDGAPQVHVAPAAPLPDAPGAQDENGAEALCYDPNHLVDALRNHLGLENDAALARRLHVRPPTLSKVRNRRVAVSPALLIAMHEASGLPIHALRRLMGDHRAHFSPLVGEESVTINR
jgi:hypothetical protein